MTETNATEGCWPHSMLWYATPAEKYIEHGLPLGNGELGGMVVAGHATDRVALNHEWLWRGKGRHRDVEEKWPHLAEVRRLFFEGKVLEAGTLANDTLGGQGGVLAREGKPNRVDPYQPAGDLIAETGHADVTDYRRELDLDRATVTVSYRTGGSGYTRQYLTHAAYPVLAARFRTDGGPFPLRLCLRRIDDPDCTLRTFAEGNELGLVGQFPEGVRFAVVARVLTDGTIEAEAASATMRLRARDTLVLLSIAVDLDGQRDPLQSARDQIAAAPNDWDTLLRTHVDTHRDLYRRVSLDVGDERPHVPTDVRLAAARGSSPERPAPGAPDEGHGQDGRGAHGRDARAAADEGLLALYFNFGRYLLIASSRETGVPANLQGLWNEELDPPWQSDIHQDVNVQMNYWPAEPCGLGELTGALFEHLERFAPHAREAARKLYNCRGVWMPIQTDPWGRATPESRGWDVWIGAAAWLSQHLWQRYEWSLDTEFLRTRCYPYLKEVAAFFEDYLVPHPTKGYLVHVPSQSPENRFAGGTSPVSLCVSATMDVELTQDVLRHAIAAAEILGVDAELRGTWREILRNLPPLRTGRHGQLQEWLEDYEEAEPGHRHISHLYALYPGDGITLEETPDLARAARASLERRLSSQGGHTGWSRAWTVCCWARLREGDLAREHLRRLVLDFATDALLDLHPPRIFQVDGNFGGTAGVCEMLLQSHRGVLRLLPALPGAWANGTVRGLRGRGGFVVDLEWRDGQPLQVRVVSQHSAPCRLRHPRIGGASLTCADQPVRAETLTHDCVEFLTEAGRMYELRW